jgi:glycosyltransferase involved in cell wall biosynthesis
MALRILHVFRSPVGGLFRHVRDLSHGQKLQGHHVGLFCDSSTGGNTAASALAACRAWCDGGITARPIARLPAASDLGAIANVSQVAKSGGFDILHGHGAKGGLIARLAARRLGLPSVYTPHGGSLHYGWKSPAGALFLTTEKLLGRIGSGCVFVCAYEQRLFADKIGLSGKPSVVAHNGLWPEEFQPVSLLPDATDLLFVGEVRHLKGIDLLLQALTSLPGLTLTVVGDGPELEHHQSLAKEMGLSQRVRFAGRKPMREALTMGRIMVVPSRNESFPYVILEAAAASVPIIATRVGGIPEALPPGMLCPPDATSIATAIDQTVAQPEAAARRARELSEKMRVEFSVAVMAETITTFYASLRR